MACPSCGTVNVPGASFCSQCGDTLAPAASPAATAFARPGASSPAPEPLLGRAEVLPYRPYWAALLLAGVVASVVGWLLVLAGLHSTANEVANSFNGTSTSGSSAGPELAGGVALAAMGSLLLLPGIIGWGIHASGLTRQRGTRTGGNASRPRA